MCKRIQKFRVLLCFHCCDRFDPPITCQAFQRVAASRIDLHWFGFGFRYRLDEVEGEEVCQLRNLFHELRQVFSRRAQKSNVRSSRAFIAEMRRITYFSRLSTPYGIVDVSLASQLQKHALASKTLVEVIVNAKYILPPKYGVIVIIVQKQHVYLSFYIILQHHAMTYLASRYVRASSP